MPAMCRLLTVTHDLRASSLPGATPPSQKVQQCDLGFSQNEVIRLYYTTDHLGSIREMLDGDGTVRARYDYTPEGQRSANLITVNPLESDFGFTGHYTHAASGLVAAPYRFYGPDIERWLSRDPIEEDGGINLYGYVGNSAVMFMDYLGLDVDVYLFTTVDRASSSSKNWPNPANAITVGGHGREGAIGLKRSKDIAKEIMNHKKWSGADYTILYACSTGAKNPQGPWAPIAKEIADKTGKPVYAPDDVLWFDGKRCAIAPNAKDENGRQARPEKRDTSPEKQGHWRRFDPGADAPKFGTIVPQLPNGVKITE